MHTAVGISLLLLRPAAEDAYFDTWGTQNPELEVEKPVPNPTE